MSTEIVSTETMSSALPDAINYHNWIFSLIKQHISADSKVLEIGSGYGQYSKWLAELTSDLTCVDIDESAVGKLREELDPEVRLYQADLSGEAFSEVVGTDYDVVICLNVLEHLEDDLAGMKNIAEVLKPGACAFILTPAFNQLFGPLDKLAGHFRRYSSSQLAAVVSEAGLGAYATEYLNPVGGLGWWINSRFCTPKTLSDNSVNSQIIFFDKYILPLSKFINPVFKHFFGQSVWSLARKAGTVQECRV